MTTRRFGVRYTTLMIVAALVAPSRECAPTRAANAPPAAAAGVGLANARKSGDENDTACGRCGQLRVRRDDNSSQSVVQSRGTDERGCRTITVDCTGIANDAATILTWYDVAGTDIGSTFGSGTVTAVLRCNNDSQLTLTNGTVSSVECISG